MADFIEFLSDNALSELQKANASLVTMLENVNKVNSAIGKMSTPSGSNNAIKGLTADYLKQEKAISDLQVKLERLNQAQNRTKITNNQLEISEIRKGKAIDDNNKRIEREQAKLEASLNIYNKVQAKLNSLSNEYKALAVKKDLTGKLTNDEAKRYDFLLGKIQKYDATLKAVDATMGKYQRNVGNYASGFNPLSNSINQLTREMPAFTYSVQTGFMALSNNIPIFTDALGNAIRQNKELQAQGQPTTSVLKQLAGAFFSWQTLMGVGITLLTVFGKEIGNAITGSEDRAKALEVEKKALESKAKAEDEARQSYSRYQSDEISRSKILLETAKNVSLSYKQRIEAVKELQTRYPDYLGSLSKEKILAGDTADAENLLNEALVKRGIALASQDLIQSSINDKLKNQKWISDELNKIEQKRLELGKQISTIDPFTKNEDLRAKYEDLSRQLTGLYYLEGTLKEQYEDKNKTIEDSIKYYINQYNVNAKYLDVVKEETKATKENKKAKEEKEKIDQDSLQALEETISALQKEQKQVSFGSKTYEALGVQLKLLQTIYDGLTKKAEETTEAINGIELNDEQVYEEYFAWLKLKEATDEYIKTLASGQIESALNSIGLASAKMFLDFDENGQSTFDKLIEGADNIKERFAITFQSVGDVAQEVFGLMMELSNQRFDNEYKNLEKEKEIALAFAGDSASAREEIERQADEKRRAIRRREAQAQKQMALFNIAINTAQGVVSALAMTPPNVPLSIAIGVIGALQAGVVSAKELPQFWKGTDNAPKGWAWTDEKGAELHTDKHGNIKDFGSNKGARMKFLDAGDKIYTASETADFINGLNGILGANDINPIIVNNNSNDAVIKEEFGKLRELIKNKKSFQAVVDERGKTYYEIKNGQRTRLNDARINIETYEL